jgi:hypothetical protein
VFGQNSVRFGIDGCADTFDFGDFSDRCADRFEECDPYGVGGQIEWFIVGGGDLIEMLAMEDQGEYG